jgi:hypothetical protein
MVEKVSGQAQATIVWVSADAADAGNAKSVAAHAKAAVVETHLADGHTTVGEYLDSLFARGTVPTGGEVAQGRVTEAQIG